MSTGSGYVKNLSIDVVDNKKNVEKYPQPKNMKITHLCGGILSF
jgi:hypothetical protein